MGGRMLRRRAGLAGAAAKRESGDADAPRDAVFNQQRWSTRQERRLAIVVWIERKYHRQRAQDALGGLTPIEFEAKLTEQPLTSRPGPQLSPIRSSRPRHVSKTDRAL